jgi:hypothetical protein
MHRLRLFDTVLLKLHEALIVVCLELPYMPGLFGSGDSKYCAVHVAGEVPSVIEDLELVAVVVGLMDGTANRSQLIDKTRLCKVPRLPETVDAAGDVLLAALPEVVPEIPIATMPYN